MGKTKKLKVTLKKSRFGIIPNLRDCIKGLGLKRINHSVIVNDDPCIRGLINKVCHLVTVEEV